MALMVAIYVCFLSHGPGSPLRMLKTRWRKVKRDFVHVQMWRGRASLLRHVQGRSSLQTISFFTSLATHPVSVVYQHGRNQTNRQGCGRLAHPISIATSGGTK